jgi:hypothetical protein
LSLNSRIVDSGLVVRISRANGDIAATTPQYDNVRLPWQARATAPVRVASAQKTRVDASKNVLKLTGIAALGLGDSRKVDVEERVRGKVRLATVDDGSGDVQSEISVDLAVERSRGVPGSWVSSLTREGNGWDLGRLRCIDSGANGSTEGHLDGYIASNVGSGKCELRLCAIPELGCGDSDALLDRRDWERVDVVQSWVCGVDARGSASSRAGGMDATISIDGCRCGIGRS